MFDQPKQPKRVVMVLGMARSGTSAIARGLKAIGVDLGSRLHHPDRRNPKGYWEDNDVNYKINRSLLRTFGNPWLVDAALTEHLRLQDHAVLNDIKRQALKLIRDRLSAAACWGFKDTNTVHLLPFWQSVIADAGVEDSYVLALRNPLGCATSNISHSKLELEAGLLAWLKSVMVAVEKTQGKTRVVVSYDLLLSDPLTVLQRMAQGLGMPIADQAEVSMYAASFLDHQLRHHVYEEADLLTNPAIAAVPLCARVYRLMMRLARYELSFADEAFLLEWKAIKHEYDKITPLYAYAHAILKQNQQLDRELRAIDKSWFWRLGYPLRWLDDMMRSRRKSARLGKRLVKAYG